MVKMKLEDSLHNLHEELKNTKEVDENSKTILQEIMKDIHNILEHSEETISEEHANLVERLKNSATEFEVSHPELAGAINIVINSFSNIGV